MYKAKISRRSNLRQGLHLKVYIVIRTPGLSFGCSQLCSFLCVDLICKLASLMLRKTNDFSSSKLSRQRKHLLPKIPSKSSNSRIEY